MMKLKEERHKKTKCTCYPRDVVSAVLATATWLAGWVFVNVNVNVNVNRGFI